VRDGNVGAYQAGARERVQTGIDDTGMSWVWPPPWEAINQLGLSFAEALFDARGGAKSWSSIFPPDRSIGAS
jgi:hypothetical protein